jgi:hypothetical protein
MRKREGAVAPVVYASDSYRSPWPARYVLIVALETLALGSLLGWTVRGWL